MILFPDESLDPKTEPWTRIVRSISLRESISQVQRTDPHHPLVAVFSLLLIENKEVLEREAAPCYDWIQSSELPETVRKTLAEVFISWLEQRFSHKGKREIEEMLIGQLPDLRETQSGKDLIATPWLSELKVDHKTATLHAQIGWHPLKWPWQICRLANEPA
jgi:hypothetical protein